MNHSKTNHSYFSVRQNTTFLDWQTQPKKTKHYPHFHLRYKLNEIEGLKELSLVGRSTYQQNYLEGTYYLRTVPSAGALYPCEVYIQIRSVKELVDGIYHYEPLENNLTLLCEVEKDGVEYYCCDKSKNIGLSFFISTVYFRSSWKYRNRSIRYIFLDSGHYLGSIYAALCVMGKESQFIFDFDKLALNKAFGFRSDEMFTCGLSSGEKSEKKVERLKFQLPYVAGSDYHEKNSFIEECYTKSANYQADDIKTLSFFKTIPKERLKTAIVQRRSIRAFNGGGIPKKSFESIIQGVFDFAKEHEITIYYTLHDVENYEIGLYKNETLMQKGNFRSKSRYLSLEQNLGGQSGVTFYFTFNAKESYQKAYILCGFLGQIIYLKCELEGIGCSGIGAYYDEEVRKFLGTKEDVFYVMAIGK
jgi:SagB-type dehydrogenase family enzyme